MIPYLQAHLFTIVLLLCPMCSSDESPPAYCHSSKYALFKVSPDGIHNKCSNAICGAFLLIWVSKVLVWHHCRHVLASSWTRQSRPLLFFPSWLYLLDGEDNCMLSVPFSTSDLHFSCWQSGENCQAVAAGAFTLLGYAFWFSLRGGCSPFLSVLLSCPRAVCSMFPVF